MIGRLIAVVGASGAGKDTVIAHARDRLDDVLFVRRAITRPTDAHEDHEPLDLESFAQREAEGGFCVTWDAHGLRYGIPVQVVAHVAAGGTAVLNGSRRALPMLREAFDHVVVVEVTADEDVRAARLAVRGREDAVLIRRRLARAKLDYPGRDKAMRIANEGTPEEAGGALLRIVREHQP